MADTYCMDYIGSKEKLNTWIFDEIEAEASYQGKVFLDGCTGSGSVSRFAATRGYHVIACDSMYFPTRLVRGSIGVPDDAFQHISTMSELVGVDGFFYKNYSPAGGRLYFTEENARKIDAMRDYISSADEAAQPYLIYCGIEALSRISNTAGTHGAYLKELKSRASMPYTIRHERIVAGTSEVYWCSLLDLLPQVTADVVYIDPPYNNRQYPPNYHLYETFALNDSPIIGGKTGLRSGWQETGSPFCKAKTARQFFKDVVSAAQAPLVAISYSSDGLITEEQLLGLWEEMNLPCRLVKREQRRYKADKNRVYRDDALFEFLFLIKK